MFSPAALRLALREREIELPFTKDDAGRPVTLVVRALTPERALALRHRMPGGFYEAVQRAKPGEPRSAEQELEDTEEVLKGSILLIEEGVIGFVDPDTNAFVEGFVRFTDAELNDVTMDGRLLSAHERTTVAITIATMSGEGEVASRHARFRIRDRVGLSRGPRDVAVHPGNGSAPASPAAVPDGGPRGTEVDLGARG